VFLIAKSSSTLIAESRAELLLQWWNGAKRREYEAYSIQNMMGEYKRCGHLEGNIFDFTDKEDIQEHCGVTVKLPITISILPPFY
jgi:hypothetical protein